MTNPSESQRQRSQYNPLNLGTFDQTTLRLLTGSLGMRSKLITGGYGDYTYNHWFQITLSKPAWIILVKGGTELITSPASASSRFNNTNNRFDFSVYAQDYSPIEGRSILQEPERFFGYVAGAQSDLYNTFNPKLDSQGNEMLYELTPGNYLVCVSATRNEAFDYALGLVVEFADNEENFILSEDQDPSETSFVIQESFNAEINGIFVDSPITTNTTIDELRAFSNNTGEIESGVFVQINYENNQGLPLQWIISPVFNAGDLNSNRIGLDFTPTWPQSTSRQSSIDDWRRAWQRDHAMDNKFPSGVFAPLTNLS
jgi:hypothetical protein